ncbi:biotin--[acetyl-CoA-carboxylase] ligase [Methylacidimicrobium sp. B4]|uniref:biotin--[acetyl-CoA-carboxylase] ligase n=1 Tax=Methylacidimicrobium sp. B4 TaxID=2796139 RepID=UPI001A8E2FEB|nr:biotin--[acetyl-CoA-carboxylase] ligase [Methylacidimicrobium sp. B4]QSR84651.1 biotin--[acetyl-CoA-carboxylase] ligase [Methylacidimicrobium sp. B4]
MFCTRSDPRARVLRAFLASPSLSGSRSALSAQSGVSPAEVEEAISSLRTLGLPLSASAEDRWQLERPLPDLLSAEELMARTEEDRIAWSAIVYDRVESTSDLLLREEAAGAPEGLVVAAERQSRGRGRLGRRWESDSPGGIYTSLLLRPQLDFPQIHRLTILTTVAAAEAVEEVAGFSPRIKWPNDLMGSRGKLGGILTEVVAEGGRVRGGVVGIGLNVSQDPETFPEEIRGRASSLRIETGSRFRRVEILGALLRRIAIRYRGDFGEIRRLWEWRCESLGRMVQVRQGEGVIEGYALGLDEDGLLLLRTEAGAVVPLLAGELLGSAEPARDGPPCQAGGRWLR